MTSDRKETRDDGVDNPIESRRPTSSRLSEPMTVGVRAYISLAEYARAERDRVWRKVWQQVGRSRRTARDRQLSDL